MKASAVLLLISMVISSYALTSKTPSLASMKKFEALRSNKKSWSSIILNLAALNAKAGNPVEELLVAINAVVTDLQTKL